MISGILATLEAFRKVAMELMMQLSLCFPETLSVLFLMGLQSISDSTSNWHIFSIETTCIHLGIVQNHPAPEI